MKCNLEFSAILRYIGKIITYIGSVCTSFSAIIGMMLVVLTIVGGFYGL
jgi:phosphohistidine swiveling domain-containing protein